MRKYLFILPLFALTMASCKRGFQPIEYNRDACAHCKMTIVDDRYAAELVTQKGRAFKFDDVVCMKQYLEEQGPAGENLLFVEDYLRTRAEPIDATKALYLKHEFFASPMNGDFAAFTDEAEARDLMDSLKIPPLRWENLN